LIPITVPEVRKLLIAFSLEKEEERAHALEWSVWRRSHQASARDCHYRRQARNLYLQL